MNRTLLTLAVAATAGAAAAQVPAGAQFRANSYTTSFQYAPRIGLEREGDFVVTWISFLQDGSEKGVFSQRFAVDASPRGIEFRVNVYTTGNQTTPVIAAGRRDDPIVVWADHTGRGIQARRYDASGAIGGEFRIDAATSSYRSEPSIARRESGRFMVTWGSNDDGSGSSISARLFDAEGSPTAPEFVVNSYTTGIQSYPVVAAEAGGGYVVAWVNKSNFLPSPQWSVAGQRLDAAGARVGGEFQINTAFACCVHRPAISASSSGGFVVVWSHFSQVSGRRYDAVGDPIGSEFVVNESSAGQFQVSPQAVAHDERGNFVVVWKTLSPSPVFAEAVLGQRFNADGTRRGTEFTFFSGTNGTLEIPSVQSDLVGNLVLAWGQGNLFDFDVAALRFGGLFPTALRVDTLPPAGNGVLEPGDPADLRPAWRNRNGATQAFTAGLSNPGGPAGGVPLIVDPVSDYGTLVNGGAAECLDCYAVVIPTPPTRPALHWDGTVVETIVPDVQGQQKIWKLHVGDSFTDVSNASPFYRFVETLLHHDVTAGCAIASYCPGASTTREQMAVFVLTAMEGSGFTPTACGGTPMFADVPVASPFCRWVEALARRGVVTGCGGGNYCPTAAVSREQMAVFVLRTLDPALNPPACVPPNLFDDVPETSPFCRWVEELANRGIVTGCSGGNFCPSDNVTREEMAVFLSATFGLTLYGP